jgi:RNA polymerase sigma factor (sigma-70 family)
VTDGPETFESLRPLLFAIAYRMLASVSDAEDVLQEAYLRYRRAIDDGIAITSLKAYLSTIVTRLALDHAKSAQQRREDYVGVWLPTPLLTDDAPYDPAARAELADAVSLAFLLVLERKRRGEELDRFNWFCQKCGTPLYETVRKVPDYNEDPVSRVYEEFYSSEQKRTCGKCGHVAQRPA